MENTQKYKYFIYCRKSNGKEVDASPSINAQYNELITYAQRENLNIVGVYKEIQSAFKTGRPKLAEMLARIKPSAIPTVTTLIIWKSALISAWKPDLYKAKNLKTSRKCLPL